MSTDAKFSRHTPIDALRCVATLMVVTIHVTPIHCAGAPTPGLYSIFIQGIVRVGLPLFFMISGMFLIGTHIPSLGKWYWNRLSALLLPFLIYGYIHFLCTSPLTSHPFQDFTRALTSGPTSLSAHYWFIFSMTGIYLLAPAAHFALSTIKAPLALRLFFLLLALNAANVYLPPLCAAAGIWDMLQIPALDCWFLYFISGWLIHRGIALLSWRTIALMISLGLCATIALNLLAAHTEGLALHENDLGANMFLYAAGILAAVLKAPAFPIRPRWRALISFISAQTYGIYLIHIAVISLIGNACIGVVHHILPGDSFLTLRVLYFTLSLAAACGINLLVNPLLKRTRFHTPSRASVGQSQAKAHCH